MKDMTLNGDQSGLTRRQLLGLATLTTAGLAAGSQREAARPMNYGTWECLQSPRLVFLAPWQQCRGLKISFENSI